ncbi:17091_t:CDS:2 [Funneliformis geosporum]|nr:17091_t:CDS:2 [Funneliformis geosporum]
MPFLIDFKCNTNLAIMHIIVEIHQENAIHRDLHSGNVLYSPRTFNWYISDLGFCGPVDKPLNSIYGNLPYIAPEVIVNKEYTYASDIYSIGILMWEISSGQPPYINYEHDYYLVLRIISGMRPKFVPGTPEEYKTLMQLCLDADQSKRPDISSVSKQIKEMLLQFKDGRQINNSSNNTHLQVNNTVLDYADGNTLQKYLKNNSNQLTWYDKYNLALQLAHAVTCLHNVGIVHRDLNSDIVCVHQKSIKLVNLGHLKRIEEIQEQPELQKKHDVNRVGLILQEISSGEKIIIKDISEDLRRAKNVSEEYIKVYTECLDDNPPDINEVFTKLKAIISKNFQIILSENNLSIIIIGEIVDLIYKEVNNGTKFKVINQHIVDHINNFNKKINLQKIFNWLICNQNSSNYIFLLGYFNFSEIKTIQSIENMEIAFNLLMNASEQNNKLAHYYVGKCFQYGYGTVNDDKLAFNYYNKVAEEFASGQYKIGNFYYNGIGIEKNLEKAFYWYQKSAKKGHYKAQYKLAFIYENGSRIDKDRDAID